MEHRSLLCRAGFSLLFSLGLATANAQESAVFGPMEQVGSRGNGLVAIGQTYITVLGQTYEVAPAVAVVIGNKRYSAADAIRFIGSGAYVSVAGTETLDGRLLAQEIVVSQLPYVPGSSDVFVSGLVTAYDAATGLAQIGALQINATASLAATPSQEIFVGSRIDVFGTQSVPGGVVWATGVETNASADVQSISGTGTSLHSISGTGTSLRSISGTGASLKSISGTGTSLKSISGTGTSLDSISGTGTSLRSISGTGTSVQSISGTGMALDSISGTGTSVQSISGTGTSVQSISGTGIALDSISGTGAEGA